MRPTVTINPCDRATWPEVLRRSDLAVIFGESLDSIDRRRKAHLLPRTLPAVSKKDVCWSKTDICEWLDHGRVRERGLRIA